MDTPTWILPPRGGRPYLAAEHPATADGERGLALAADRRALVRWRRAGEEVERVPLPAEVEAVTGVVLGADRLAVLTPTGVFVHADGAWASWACERPRYGAFAADGTLVVSAGLALHGVSGAGELRWSHPCDLEQPLVALGDEVVLVDWGVTVRVTADGELFEVDNGAALPVVGAVRVGDAVVALCAEGDERRLLVIRGDEEESVDLPEEWTTQPFAAAGDRGVLIGTEFFPLDGGEPVAHVAASVSAAEDDALACDGEHLWALRGGAISSWRLGEPEELGPVGLAHPISWDAAPDGRLAVVVPGVLVLLAPDGEIAARVPVEKASQVRFFAGGARVAVTNLEGPPGLRAFDAVTGALLAEHAGPVTAPQALAALPDGRLVVTQGFALHVLDEALAPVGVARAKANGHASSLHRLDAAGAWLAALDTGQTLHTFRVTAGGLEPVAVVPRGRFAASSLALAGDVAVACADDGGQGWDLATGKPAGAGIAAEIGGRGGVVWAAGEVRRLDGQGAWPCPARPSALVAAGGHAWVELHEGLLRLA